jgi:repressor LexA
MADTVRPTKKQRELLNYIEQFIGEHGYSPSYREIMNGLQYTSVATVALHINNLIKRGHLRKRDHSARSLEVVTSVRNEAQSSESEAQEAAPAERAWLPAEVARRFKKLESADVIIGADIDELFVLCGALKIIGFEEEAALLLPRLDALKQRLA